MSLLEQSAHLDHRQVAEWAPHRACWLAWPAADNLWQENFLSAQREFVALAKKIAESEDLEILVRDSTALLAAQEALGGLKVKFHQVPYGDIWMRDIAPIFMKTSQGLEAACFAFNGWGGKHILPFDDKVSAAVATLSGASVRTYPWVLEGGAIENDGEGTLITTEQCLLNANRFHRGNVSAKSLVEKRLCEAFGARRVIWLKEGLLNDHTDGHVDTLARFVRPGVVACMQATTPSDPNAKVLDQIAADLAFSSDAQGRKLEVVRVPSPGRVLDDEGEVMPASYMNFYLSNGHVIVPVYGAENDAAAVASLAKLFPERTTVGLMSRAILSGGGAFHCITQQEPQV